MVIVTRCRFLEKCLGQFRMITLKDGATNVAVTPAFTWVDDPEAADYSIVVATDAGFTNIVATGTSTVNVRHTANGGNTQLGALRGAADSTFTAVLPKSKWKTSTSGNGQLAILEIDL